MIQVGDRFEHLVVLAEGPRRSRLRTWQCRCDCGSEMVAQAGNLRSGHTRSCGCRGVFVSVGDRFTRLEVLKRATATGAKMRLWSCRCDCGRVALATARHLLDGRVKSCGCYKDENTRRRELIHGHTAAVLVVSGKETPEYRCWRHLKERCLDPENRQYADYGGRGITVCPTWRVSFESFIAHVGRRPSPTHSIDRIDNDGHYEPGNVRWATRKEQAANKRPRRASRGHRAVSALLI